MMRPLFTLLTLFSLFTLNAQEEAQVEPIQMSESVEEPAVEGQEAAAPQKRPTLYDLNFNLVNIEGVETSLEPFKGDLILCVPFATESGFIDQLRGLEFLQREFSSYGLTILLFPTNSFGGQEPRSEPEIKDWFLRHYTEMDFPLFARSNVVGEEIDPLFAFLKEEGAQINWNFTKIFISRKGRFLKTFPAWQDPTSPIIVTEIIRMLRDRGTGQG